MTVSSGVSRISFRGGGGSKYFGKSGGICMALRFGEYFAKILYKKIVKIFIFYIKIIDNVLLRTLYLGVLEHTAYSPDFLLIVQFGTFWSTFSVIFLLIKHI